MNWDAVGAIAELLAAFGVILSLLYLAAQIRQNTQSVRASTFQEFTRESAETARLAITERNLLEDLTPFLLGDLEFDPVRDRPFGLMAGLWARNLQFGFMELQKDRIDKRLFDSYVSYHAENWMRTPGWAKWWEVNRKHYDPDFVAWLDSELSS
ncbi:MAG: hypothetical protein Hals2KO_05390 [Halioglobus sp.]